MYSIKTSNGKQSNNAERGLLSDPVLDNQDEMVLESDNEESQVNTMLPQLWESTLTGFDDDRVVFDSDEEDFEEHYVLPFLETDTFQFCIQCSSFSGQSENHTGDYYSTKYRS